MNRNPRRRHECCRFQRPIGGCCQNPDRITGILSRAGITQQIVIDRDIFFYIPAQPAVLQIHIQALGFVDGWVFFQQMVIIGSIPAGINNDPCVVGVRPKPQIIDGSPATRDGTAGVGSSTLSACWFLGAILDYLGEITAFAVGILFHPLGHGVDEQGCLHLVATVRKAHNDLFIHGVSGAQVGFAFGLSVKIGIQFSGHKQTGSGAISTRILTIISIKFFDTLQPVMTKGHLARALLQIAVTGFGLQIAIFCRLSGFWFGL